MGNATNPSISHNLFRILEKIHVKYNIQGQRYTWKQTLTREKQMGHDTRHLNKWVVVPVVIENQRLFTVSPDLCHKVKVKESRLQFILYIRVHFSNSWKKCI